MYIVVYVIALLGAYTFMNFNVELDVSMCIAKSIHNKLMFSINPEKWCLYIYCVFFLVKMYYIIYRFLKVFLCFVKFLRNFNLSKIKLLNWMEPGRQWPMYMKIWLRFLEFQFFDNNTSYSVTVVFNFKDDVAVSRGDNQDSDPGRWIWTEWRQLH